MPTGNWGLVLTRVGFNLLIPAQMINNIQYKEWDE